MALSSDQRVLKAAAEAIEAVQQGVKSWNEKDTRKSTERHHYNQATKTAIGKYALINGSKQNHYDKKRYNTSFQEI